MNAIIRRAEVHEAPLLTDLMRRSKAHWGYDAAFMLAARPYLIVSSESIESGQVYGLEIEGTIAGFHYLKPSDAPGVVLLSDLFIDPASIGRGFGRYLWDHAVVTARAAGYQSMIFEADPNAVGFYERMGAVKIGERESTVQQGRMLPTIHMDL